MKMKRVAVVLILITLILCSAFAYTNSKNATSGNKLIVVVTIDEIYPLYNITASNNDTSVTSGSSDGASVPSIRAIKVYDSNNQLTDVQIKIGLNHFGYENNDADERVKVPIRYANTVNVTIEANPLENENEDTANHVAKSSNPVVVDGSVKTTTSSSTTDFEVSANSTGNKVNVKAEYKTGLSVVSEQIAECTFDWDVTSLTAGDTYQAGVIVTYEII